VVRRQRALILGGFVGVVALAVGLSLALSGGTGSATPATSQAISSAPLAVGSTPRLQTFPAPVTARPGIVQANTPPPAGVTSVPASPSAAVTPAAGFEPGIRAVRIRIPSVGIDQPIVQGDGVDAPLRKAAHFPGTGWPGGGTNIYLYGHAREGMFIGLWDVKVGAEIDVDLVDGTQRAYKVTTVLPSVPADAFQYTDPTPTEQLTLQTCTSYQDTAPRFIVIAVPAT
jgi:LPXTG-site transpeptidase (sortase) family protein